MKWFSERIVRARYVVILMVTAITLLMLWSLKDLKVNADVLSYLPEQDPSALLFNRIGDVYGGNSMVIVGLSGQEVFEYETLQNVRQLTDSIRAVRGIGYVTSLTNVLNIHEGEYGIEIGRLIDEFDIPSDPDVLDSLKAYTLSKKMYRGNLVSEDATATLVIGTILNGHNHADVVDEVKSRVGGLPFADMIYFGGMPVTLHELSRIIVSDILTISPVAFILISLLLLAGFRNIRGVLFPMLAVLIAVIWTMGTITLSGFEITMLTNTLPVILLAVGSAYAIHVVNAFFGEQQINHKQAIQRTVAYIAVPVVLASVTTMLGFLSFIAGSYMLMIREFGVFSTLGIFYSMVLSITFVPAMLSVTNQKKSPRQQVSQGKHVFERIAEALSTMIHHHKNLMLAVWAVLVLASIVGMLRIERRFDLIDYFRKDNIVRVGEDLLAEKFNGSSPLYVNIKGDVQSPEVLRLMSKTQDHMERFDYIPHSQSVADLIKQMNEVMGEGNIVPDDEWKIVQLWFLLDGQEVMDQLVSPDLSEGVIQAFVTSREMDVLREIEQTFDAYVAQHSTEHYSLAYTGIPVLLKRLDESIIRSQTYSLIIAMTLVVLMVSVLLRSLLKGLTAVIPIGITLLVLFGIMGLGGIPLDIATVLTGSITIGIGIDYAIHFISRFDEGIRKGLTQKASLERTIRTSGRAILINMLSVSVGFSTLLFSNLVPMQRFGLLITATMLVAGMASLTLLPMLLLRIKK